MTTDSYKLSVISEGCPCCVLLESTYGVHMLETFRVQREELDLYIGDWLYAIAETGAPYRVERHDTN